MVVMIQIWWGATAVHSGEVGQGGANYGGKHCCCCCCCCCCWIGGFPVSWHILACWASSWLSKVIASCIMRNWQAFIWIIGVTELGANILLCTSVTLKCLTINVMASFHYRRWMIFVVIAQQHASLPMYDSVFLVHQLFFVEQMKLPWSSWRDAI